jgi:4-amino-4-deoxy-L-arabinose transferase-like glycosyltransferase
LRLGIFALNVGHSHPFFFEPDSTDYLRDAVNLAHGGGLRDLQGAPSMRRTPGYSALLAILFALGAASPSAPHAVVVLQIILSALTVSLAAGVAFRLEGASAALAAGLLLALEPSGIAASGLIMTETLYTFVLLCAFALWSRWWLLPSWPPLIALACTIGVVPLIRPAGMYLPFLFAILILGWRPPGVRGVRAAVVFLLLALAPLGIWRGRNYRALGSTEVSSIGPWVKAMFARSVAQKAGEAPDPAAPWSQDFASERGIPAARAMAMQNEYFRRVVRSHPFLVARQFLLNATLMVGVPNDRLAVLALEHPPELAGGSVTSRLAWLVATGPLSLLLVLGMMVSLGGLACTPLLLWRSRGWDPHRKSLALAVVAVALYQWGISSLIQYQADRYRIPMMPLLAVSLAVVILSAAPKSDRG